MTLSQSSRTATLYILNSNARPVKNFNIVLPYFVQLMHQINIEQFYTDFGLNKLESSFHQLF